ncbi:MAG: hypothetical protein JSV79_05050 [Armatimonadota bacterium]|nr:MAG: hypothetical protein JSV79_05050 [Armatimonadota bacterium]
MPKRKVTRKRASRKQSKRKTAPKRKPRRTAVAVGDAVRLPPERHNEIRLYDPKLATGARAAEAIEGIVCSIRDIRTGKLVPKTKGDLTGFVLEILHTQTFRAQFSSEKNVAGSSGAGALTDNPLWLNLRAALQETAARRDFASAGSGALLEEPFASFLDGWRVVKVKAEAVEPLA